VVVVDPWSSFQMKPKYLHHSLPSGLIYDAAALLLHEFKLHWNWTKALVDDL
jgi:hypothetical protein